MYIGDTIDEFGLFLGARTHRFENQAQNVSFWAHSSPKVHGEKLLIMI